MKKYELLPSDEVAPLSGNPLFRIRAIVDTLSIGVKVGDLGGYIEKESNLSHSGDAKVFANARVYGDEQINK